MEPFTVFIERIPVFRGWGHSPRDRGSPTSLPEAATGYLYGSPEWSKKPSQPSEPAKVLWPVGVCKAPAPRNRDKWDQYRDAANEMLYRTNTLVDVRHPSGQAAGSVERGPPPLLKHRIRRSDLERVHSVDRDRQQQAEDGGIGAHRDSRCGVGNGGQAWLMEGITGTETSGPWMPVGLALGGVVSRRELWASRPYPPRTAPNLRAILQVSAGLGSL